MAQLIVDGNTELPKAKHRRDLATKLPTVRLFLVEGQEIVRNGLRTILETKPDLKVIGEAENGERAIAQLKALKKKGLFPDVVLTDVEMPEMDGVIATQYLRQQFPDVRILILTGCDDPQYVTAALQDGAKGYLLKDTPADELVRAIRSIRRGYTQFGPGLLEKALAQPVAEQRIAKVPAVQFEDKDELTSGLAELTKREREVLQLVARGANNREIAESLFISTGTVRNHVSNILGRLNLRDRTQAAIVANAIAA